MGTIMVLYFSSGSTGPYCELANQQTRLCAAQTGCDLAWWRRSHTEPGPQALYQQLVSPGAGGPGRSSRGWEPCGLEAVEGASEEGGSRTKVWGRHFHRHSLCLSSLSRDCWGDEGEMLISGGPWSLKKATLSLEQVGRRLKKWWGGLELARSKPDLNSFSATH